MTRRQKLLDMLRDAHVYGGLLAGAVALGARFGVWAGILLIAAHCWFVGVFRMRPPTR